MLGPCPCEPRVVCVERGQVAHSLEGRQGGGRQGESTDGRQAGSGSSGWCFLGAVGSEVALKESGRPRAPQEELPASPARKAQTLPQGKEPVL